MIVSRQDFLTSTTAFTSVNLYHPVASASLNPAEPYWHQVWFRPSNLKPIDTKALKDLNIRSLPDFLTFSAYEKDILKHTIPGSGMKQEATTHIVHDDSEPVAATA